MITMKDITRHINIYTLQRWLRMFVLALFACSISVLIYPALDSIGHKLTELMSAAHYPALFLIFWFLITTLFWFFLIKLGGFRIADIYSITSLRYPPTWFFAFISVFFYTLFVPFLWRLPKPYDISFQSLFIVISLIPGIVTACLLHIPFSKRGRESAATLKSPISDKAPKNMTSLIKEPSDFIQWLNEEKPIQTPSDDLFDMGVFSRRIAWILHESPLKTISLVGNYGCGKSSILRMIEYFINDSEKLYENTYTHQREKHFNAKNIITCQVSGWGLHKGAASEHILKTTIEKLSLYVDCLGLINIPSHYRSALSRSGSAWGQAFAALLGPSQDPLEILRRLDIVLDCIKKRLVIYLEDLDRNTVDNAYWDEIISLLDRLKDLDNISFILAVNQDLRRDNVLLRISEHIEFVPILPRTHIINCLKYFRSICLDKYPDDIDFRSKEERDEHLGFKRSHEEYDIAGLLGIETDEPIIMIARLLNNPRALKATLRDTWRTWECLHGELDFDDLLVARVLYTVAPESFAFINEHISQIRQLASDSSSEHSRERIEKTRNKLKSQWQEIESVSWDKNAVDTLIEFLFPGWVKDSFYETIVPQGLSRSEPTDYWIRLNKEDVSDSEILDQVVLHTVNDWKKNHSIAIYKGLNLAQALFQIDGFADKIEQFGMFLDGNEVRSLAAKLFETILKEGGRLKKEEHYPGFLQLWRLSLNKPIDSHERWVVEEIRKALPLSLRFANELYYYWRNQERGLGSAKIQTPLVRTEFIAAGKEIFENDIHALITAIDPGYIYSIYHFMIHYSQPDGGGPGFKPAEWDWFIHALMEAGEKNPQVVVPQIVPLVIDEQNQFRGKLSYTLSQEKLDTVFQNNQRRVMQILATEIDTSRFDLRDEERLKFARTEAIQWLHEHQSEESQ